MPEIKSDMVMDPIELFAAEARRYIAFIEEASSLPLQSRLTLARRRLLELYLAACGLPDGVEPGDLEPAASPPTPTNWAGFDHKDIYWEVYDPYENDEPVASSLSDDLLDIYKDLSPSLALWDAGHRVEAVWHWRFLFDVHWGDHATDVLRALHRACKRL